MMTFYSGILKHTPVISHLPLSSSELEIEHAHVIEKKFFGLKITVCITHLIGLNLSMQLLQGEGGGAAKRMCSRFNRKEYANEANID